MKTKSTSQIIRKSVKNIILVAITVLALSASPPSRGDADCLCLTKWTGSTGDWFNASNWSFVVPDCGQQSCGGYPVEAQINNGGTAQITATSPTGYVCQLFFGYNSSSESGKLSVNHGTLNMCNEIFVGYHGKGVLSISNGGVVSTLPVGASVASLTGSNGTVTVDGANSRWTITGALYLAGTINSAGGTALLSVTNGGSVTAGSAQVYPSGTITGNGTVTTSGGVTIDGTLKPSGQLTIGGSGGLTLHGSATTVSNVVPSAADNVSVSGAASLGGRLSVTMTGTFTPGTTYTLLHAVGGRVSIFASQSITYPPGQCFTPVITYDANNVYLYLEPTCL